MIRRRPHVRQPKRDVCRLAVSNELDRNQSLIVIWRDDDIKLAGVRAVVKTIRGMGTGDGDSFFRAALHGRCQDIDVFPSEHPAFSGMRIDCRDRNAARIKFQLPQFCIDESNQAHVAFGGDLAQALRATTCESLRERL